MRSESKLKRNLSLQTIFQIINVSLPFITAPYLARVLGAEQLGIFSYTYSVVSYFTLLAMLGTVSYGTKSIASVKDSKKERSKTFWNIFCLQIIVTSIALVFYVVYLLFFCEENYLIANIQIINIIACLFDINWFFWGIEKFELVIWVNVIVKILTVISIICLVKNVADLWIYALIMFLGTLLSQLCMFKFLFRYVSWERIDLSLIKSHLRCSLILFIPLLATSVYHTMDKTMLGIFSTYEQSGFYYNSDKVINIPMNIINGIGIVMLPRISNLRVEQKFYESEKLCINTLELISAAGIAISCGIASVSKEFIPFFYGEGYEACILLTIVFAPIFLVKSISAIIRMIYLIPMSKEREYTKAVIAGAVINLFSNILLIPKYGALGAVIATFLAELGSALIQIYYISGSIKNFKKAAERFLIYSFIGLFMILVVRGISCIFLSNLIKLLLEISVGSVLYASLCTIYWKKTNNRFYNTLIIPLLEPFSKRHKYL